MNIKDNHLIVSSAPHIANPVDTANIMKNVVIALMPALAVAVYVFGVQALILTAIVISFGVTAFTVVLLQRAYHAVNTDDLDQLKATDT